MSATLRSKSKLGFVDSSVVKLDTNDLVSLLWERNITQQTNLSGAILTGTKLGGFV